MPRKLEEARLDSRRICSQPDRNEIWSVLLVTFSFPPSCLRLETSDSVIDIRAFSCPSCFRRVPSPPLSSLIPLSANRRAASPLFSRLPSGRNPLSKKYPWILRIYRHPVSPSGFPFFIVPSPAAIAISASAAKRTTTSLRGHPLSSVYVIFFSGAIPLFGSCGYLGIGLWLSFHKIRSERLWQHLYLLSRFSTSFFRRLRATVVVKSSCLSDHSC